MTTHLQKRVERAAEDAVRTWPARDQEAVAIGEIGELLTLVGRSAQGRANPEEWATELADVYIMLHQLISLRSTQKDFEQALDRQMTKLEGRIARHEGRHPEAEP